jgi:hypothetical protein
VNSASLGDLSAENNKSPKCRYGFFFLSVWRARARPGIEALFFLTPYLKKK